MRSTYLISPSRSVRPAYYRKVTYEIDEGFIGRSGSGPAIWRSRQRPDSPVVEEAGGTVAEAISLMAVAISLGSPGTVLPAVASQNIEETTLRETEIVSGTKIVSETKIISDSGIISAEISLLEIPIS